MRGSHHYQYFEVGERELATGLYLTSAGLGKVEPGTPYPAPGHPGDYRFSWSRGRVLTDTAFVLIGTGGGEFESRFGSFRWRAGEAVLLPPGVWHRYRPDRDSGWTECWLTLSGELTGRLWQQWDGLLPIRPLPMPRPEAAVADLHQLIDEVMRAAGGINAGGRAQPLTWIARGLELVGRHVEQHLGVIASPAGDEVVERALRFLRNHAHRPLAIAEVAAAVGITRRTLERRFSAVVGRSPGAELEALRVQRARRLLIETNRPVKEIAYLCGFRESRGLIRACRRCLDLSPGAIRRRSGQSL